MCFSATRNMLLLSLRSKLFRASWSRKLGRESKKRGMSPGGGGGGGTSPSLSYSTSFALAPTFAQYLHVKRLLRRLIIAAWRDWHKDFPRFQGTRPDQVPDHARISSFLGCANTFITVSQTCLATNGPNPLKLLW